MGDVGKGPGTGVETGVPETIRVVLVDDEPDLAEVTALHLDRRRDAFDVTIVTSGQGALEAVERGDVDCLVSDYEMPEMDGLALLRAVQERAPSIPFILYTGRGSEEIASEAISAGVTDYLQKRVTSDQYDVLANRIENAVARRRSEEARKETEFRYRTLVEASPHAILVHFGERVVYANDTMARLLDFDDRTEIYAASPLAYVHPEDRTRVRERMRTVLDGSRENTDWLPWRLQRDDGTVRHVESRGTPVVYDGKPAVQVVIRDVTEQHRHERHLEALNDATRDLLTADSPEAVAQTAADVVSVVLDEPFAGIFEYADETLVPLAATDAATDRTAVSRDEFDRLRLADGTVELAAFHEGTPRVVEDYGSREDTLTDAFETVFLYPLNEHGLLSVASVEANTFDQSDRDLLEILGQSVTVALDRLAEE
ncbi:MULTISPECIES: response regulator [Haloarcula]|uniref:PAS domain S-box-containing protein n=1 Tax=Haloarcula pellucida TaxID=1427151 RepID=A0A830GSN8_9EURY|nr:MULTISPECIES: response regulator [Halomicroarcula]MBX0349373.1 response regulator [Halomicroarcula pellucida]MDS0279041.1 response regulator [Halomicroarcula sp. S1AR25-4]GGO03252.1 hypothetical protein GCM10009030_38720 [Halomicroarcula pellucida]